MDMDMDMHAYKPPEAPGRMVGDANLTSKLIKLNKINQHSVLSSSQPDASSLDQT